MRNSVVFVAAWASLAQSALAITPYELIQNVNQKQGTLSFEAHRVQTLTRQTVSLKAAMKVAFKDPSNYRVIVEDPGTLADVNIWLHDDQVNIFFPDENLYFHNDNRSGSTEFHPPFSDRSVPSPICSTETTT